MHIVMKKITSLLFVAALALFNAIALTAQFDDLYFDGSESLSAPDEYYAYNDDEFDSEAYQESEAYTYDDEIDEYIDYYSNDFEIDGYQYTNRLQRYRLAIFTSNYYGVPYWGTGAGFDSYFLSRYANDPFFASYIRNQLIFGPSYTRLRSYYGYGPYADPFSSFYNPWRTSGLYVGIGIGYGRGFGYNPFGIGYGGYGGFSRGFGGGYYCPPYYGGVASNRLSRFNNGVVSNNVVNTTRRTGTTTTSTRRNTSYVNTSSVRTNTTSTSTRRSVRNSGNTRDRNISSRKAVSDRNRIGTSSSRRTSTRSTGTRVNPRSSNSRTNSRVGSSSRSSYQPSGTRSSTRSIGTSRSGSSRSTSTRSSTRSSSPRSSGRSSGRKSGTTPR